MPKDQNETINSETGRESQASESAIKAIGVLFVHGIGVQKRGDTLFQCGSAIHNWMQEWISQPSIEEGSNLVDFLDTTLTQPKSDEPAHSRLIIHKKDLISDRSFLLAESCWAEAFHPPRYREFARWALRVLPITVSLHVVRSFSRNLRILNKAGNAIRSGQISLEDFKQLQIDIGPSYGPLPTEWPALRKILSDQAYHAGKRWMMSPLVLVAFLFFAIFLQSMLLAMIVIGFLPVDFLRSFVNLVQKKVAAILGDCYLFVTSPISASAVVTQFKKDFEWIADRCDKVVILAHSQGAAVAHRAIEEWSWEGKIPKKLKLLITYGSGLQKLTDLKQPSHKKPPMERYKNRMFALLAAVGSIAIMTSCLWLVGIIPFLLFALNFITGYILVMLSLFFFEDVSRENPELPVGVEWKDYFASNDPVPNGPISVEAPKFSSTNNFWLNKAFTSMGKGLVDFFQIGHSHEVVNLQSRIADHNTYWSAKDDFVSRVVMELFRICEIPSPATPDTEWIKLAVQRRRWRVGLRARCRSVAILAALCIPLLPQNIIESLSIIIVGQLSGASEWLPKNYTPDWIQSVVISEWLYVIGIGALFVCISVMFAIATVGWNIWERHEFTHFFRRKPYQAAVGGLAVFAVGWMGILVMPIVATVLSVGGHLLWPSLLISTFLFFVSAWALKSSGKGPGRMLSWISTLLERGESLLEQKTGNHSENLARAEGYFSWANKWMLDEKDSMERVRALTGLARVLEQIEKKSESEHMRLKSLYEMAINSLERMGEDTRAVRERLDKLLKEGNSAMTIQEPGDSPP